MPDDFAAVFLEVFLAAFLAAFLVLMVKDGSVVLRSRRASVRSADVGLVSTVCNTQSVKLHGEWKRLAHQAPPVLGDVAIKERSKPSARARKATREGACAPNRY